GAGRRGSRRLASSTRREGDEANQIYILDLASGGEAARATSLSTGANSPRWSPDGKSLLFTSTVYPGAGDDQANRKIAAERRARRYKARVFDGFPVRQWDRWLDDLQPHAFVQAVEPGAKAKDLLAGTRLVAEPGFAGGPDALAGREDLDAVWAPDRASIVFAVTTKRNTAAFASYGTHLYQVTASGGEPQRISSGDDSYSKPVFRPDGKALYCRYTHHGENAYYLDRVARFDWPSPGERT